MTIYTEDRKRGINLKRKREKHLKKKTHNQELKDIIDSLHAIMGTLLDFRDFLHNEILPEIGFLLQKYQGKSDSEWTQEDIEKLKKIRRFQKSKIISLRQIVADLRSIKRKYAKENT